jgi:hypothetical protein
MAAGRACERGDILNEFPTGVMRVPGESLFVLQSGLLGDLVSDEGGEVGLRERIKWNGIQDGDALGSGPTRDQPDM